jgi:hypothetical protein
MLKIITDNKWKNLKYGYEVPARVLSSDFSHLEDGENEDGFILYRRRWYHVSDFMRCTPGIFPANWSGYVGDSFFSGVLIELSEDGEQYRIALYLS